MDDLRWQHWTGGVETGRGKDTDTRREQVDLCQEGADLLSVPRRIQRQRRGDRGRPRQRWQGRQKAPDKAPYSVDTTTSLLLRPITTATRRSGDPGPFPLRRGELTGAEREGVGRRRGMVPSRRREWEKTDVVHNSFPNGVGGWLAREKSGVHAVRMGGSVCTPSWRHVIG